MINSLEISVICWARPYLAPVPGLGVASNLNDPLSQGLPKLSQPGLEMSNSLKDPYIICIARGSPKLPQPGPGVANSPIDLYVICVTDTRPDPPLGP